MRTHTAVDLGLENSNAFIIRWPRGTGLDFHDHEASDARIIVLEGKLFEYQIDDRNQLAGVTRLNGDTWTVPRWRSHKIGNCWHQDAVSLHIYSPPLVTTYEPRLELTDYGVRLDRELL